MQLTNGLWKNIKIGKFRLHVPALVYMKFSVMKYCVPKNDLARYNFTVRQPIIKTLWQECSWQSELPNGNIFPVLSDNVLHYLCYRLWMRILWNLKFRKIHEFYEVKKLMNFNNKIAIVKNNG